MSDLKYGQIFTAQDVANIAAVLLQNHGPDGPMDVQKHVQAAVTAVHRGPGLQFPPSEPVFVLRGQDQAAPATIQAYHENAGFNGAGREHLDGSLQAGIEFVQWQSANPDKVKVPD